MTRCDWIQSRVANSRWISNVIVSVLRLTSLRTDTLTLEIHWKFVENHLAWTRSVHWKTCELFFWLDDKDFAEEFQVGKEKQYHFCNRAETEVLYQTCTETDTSWICRWWIQTTTFWFWFALFRSVPALFCFVFLNHGCMLHTSRRILPSD